MYYHHLAVFCDSTCLDLCAAVYQVVITTYLRSEQTPGWSSGQVMFQIIGGVLPLMHLEVESSL